MTRMIVVMRCRKEMTMQSEENGHLADLMRWRKEQDDNDDNDDNNDANNKE